MNIKMSTQEFDNFIMLYLKDRIEAIDDIDPSQEIFLDFITKLKGKSFWPILNKVMLDSPMIERVNTKRIIAKKEKIEVSETEGTIQILM